MTDGKKKKAEKDKEKKDGGTKGDGKGFEWIVSKNSGDWKELKISDGKTTYHIDFKRRTTGWMDGKVRGGEGTAELTDFDQKTFKVRIKKMVGHCQPLYHLF